VTATFVHLGDTHLHASPRQADRLRALDQVIEAGRAMPNLSAWLWPGDLFDALSSINDRNALKERVKLMASRAPVVVCYGNHERPGDLDIFADLGTTWPIVVVDTPKTLSLTLATGQTATIFVLPFPTAAGLVSAGVAPGDIVQTARQALEAIFLDAAAQLEAARARGDLTLMIGHVNVAGSLTSVGQPNIGQEIELDPALLARLGDCYKGLNHIHKAQQIGGAYYPGSICRLSWGEIEPKGYLTVTYDGFVYTVTSHQVDVHPMYHVEGWLSIDALDDFAVMAGPDGEPLDAPPSWRGCEVRVRARYHQSARKVLELAKAHVLALFAEAARLDLELIAVPDRALRAPAVAAARTLIDKVRAWAEVSAVVVTDAALAKLPALEHGDHDTTVAECEQLVGALVRVIEEDEVPA
jgi:DNA repair exonuclease SbcCD nuclease subunit